MLTYAGELEGDLAMYYHGDDAALGNLWDTRTRLSFRRLQVLIDRLPPESALKTAMRNGLTDAELLDHAKRHPQAGHGPWSHVAMILADIRDQAAWIEYAVYRSQGGKPSRPEPMPRPGVVSKTKKTDAVTPLNAAGLNYLRSLRAERG